MSIPPVILLAVGISAALLFVIIFIICWIITFRNRKIIKNERKH